MKKLSLLLFMVLFALVSCSDNERGGDGPTLGEGEAVVDMTFYKSSTRVPAEEEIAQGTAEEKQINTLDLFIFKGNEYICRRPAKPGSSAINFRATVPAGDGYDIYFIANLRDYIEQLVADGTLLNDTTDTWKPTLSEIQPLLIDSNPARFADDEAGNVDNSANRSNLPMYGERKNASIKENDITHWGNLNLMRAVAGIDVYCANGVADFEFDNAYLYFVPDKGSIFPLADYDMNANSAESKSAPDMKTSLDFGPITANNHETVAYKFYLYDNDTDKDTFHSTDRRYTRIVVGGKYKGVTNYYPIDFTLKLKDTQGRDSLALDKITRNKKYVIVISKVTGPGYPSPGEASKEPQININSDVLNWNLEDGTNGAYDGTYYLFIGKKEANVGPTAGSQDYISIETNAGPDAIFFDFKEKLDSSGNPINGHQTTILDSGGNVIGIENERFKVEKVLSDDGTTVEEIRFTAKGAYDTSNPDRNEEIVEIQVGNIKFEVPLKQVEGINPWDGEQNIPGNLGKN